MDSFTSLEESRNLSSLPVEKILLLLSLKISSKSSALHALTLWSSGRIRDSCAPLLLSR
jgi:hypothetical protein